MADPGIVYLESVVRGCSTQGGGVYRASLPVSLPCRRADDAHRAHYQGGSPSSKSTREFQHFGKGGNSISAWGHQHFQMAALLVALPRGPANDAHFAL